MVAERWGVPELRHPRPSTFFCLDAVLHSPPTMPSFSLPPINDNPDGGWGPSTSNLPDQFKFKDIPYAPYSKSDKLGRFADWNDLSGDNRQTAVGLPSTQNHRGGGRGGGRGGRENQAFGSGTASAFAYFHVEDESSFSLVDNKAVPPRRGGAFARGRGNARGGGYAQRGAQRGGRGGFNAGRGGGQRGGRRGGWRDWEKVNYIYYAARIWSLKLLSPEQPHSRIVCRDFSSMADA